MFKDDNEQSGVGEVTQISFEDAKAKPIKGLSGSFRKKIVMERTAEIDGAMK